MAKKLALFIGMFAALSSHAEVSEEFPCAHSLRASLGAETFAQELDLLRSLTLLNYETDLPNPEAFTKWKEIKGYVTDHTNLETYPKLSIACEDQRLFPTHPQQALKLYHRFNSNQYNHAKLHADDEPCLIGAKNGTSVRKASCLRADLAYDVIISDTFQDACGHYYRGFRAVAYLGRNESVATLFSAGRTSQQRPGSVIEKEFVPGDTFPVDLKDLLFVGPLLPGDEEEIPKLRERSRASTTYDSAKRTFRLKN